MLTVGSVSRERASETFPFLADRYPGRRKAIKEFTHLQPDYVFWIDPDGALLDAKGAHRLNPPKGYEHILNDAPRYGGFLRGRIASNFGPQLVVVYCERNALAADSHALSQFVNAFDQIPIPIDAEALVISDNGDLYGTIRDIRRRAGNA